MSLLETEAGIVREILLNNAGVKDRKRNWKRSSNTYQDATQRSTGTWLF